MQCILYKIYFLEGFSYVLQIDMHFICTPMWIKNFILVKSGCYNLVSYRLNQVGGAPHGPINTPLPVKVGTHTPDFGDSTCKAPFFV
jgi:hypothetical protein